MTAAILRRCPALKTIVANPVVVRDLRAQMRGTKSYFYQGGYLLLLGILAIAGYAQATRQAPWSNGVAPLQARDIVEAQGQLQSFYYFIFLTLAALICVIGPALTASSIVGERQRLSLDLLVTTPLSAAQILIGKLISSIAFLGLLLALSLPASALCILLGGATLGDVFRAYLLLATDGLVLAGIGLYFSCAVRAPLLAMIWTYGAVVAFLVATAWCAAIGFQSYPPGLPGTPILAIAALNPFLAVVPDLPAMFALGGATLPLWPLTLVAAFLLLRLLVTASTYRLAVYGGQSAPSLRRQALVLSGLVSILAGQGFAVSQGNTLSNSSPLLATVAVGFVIAFGAAVPFLPALFVPASAEDAPPGAVAETADDPRKLAPFEPQRAFRPEHAGALPWYGLWAFAVIGGALVGLRWGGVWNALFPLVAIVVGFYLSGLGFALWAASRLARSLVRSLTSARAAAFGIFVALSAAPLLCVALRNTNWRHDPVLYFWLFRPALFPDMFEAGTMPAMLMSGLLGFATGAALLVVGARLRRRSGRFTGPAAAREA